MMQLKSSGPVRQHCLNPLFMGNHSSHLDHTHSLPHPAKAHLKECSDIGLGFKGLQDVPEGPIFHSVEGSL